MPYSIVQAVTVEPFGLTVPFSVAVVAVIELAAVVVTVGARSTAAVLNVSFEPFVVPPAFVATTRKS